MKKEEEEDNMKSKVEQHRKEIEREQKELRDARMQLSKKRKELSKRERAFKEEETAQIYDKFLIDAPITWISTPVIIHLRKRQVSFVSLNPEGYGQATDTNPMGVDSPASHKNISIVLPNTYVKFSGKVRVTIEPIIKRRKKDETNKENI
jgi:hypothetical protein